MGTDVGRGNALPVDVKSIRRRDWAHYYRVTASRPPRELLRASLRLLEVSPPGERLAVDLGCGAGVETVELLRHGWRVFAVDISQSAINQLRAAVRGEFASRLDTRVLSAKDVRLPSADLIWAGLSLPFLTAEDFSAVWKKILPALKPGGIFAGDFFGPRHAWSGEPTMSFHTATAVRQLCGSLEIELFVSELGRRMTAQNGIVRWHAFGVIAKKPFTPYRSTGSSAK